MKLLCRAPGTLTDKVHSWLVVEWRLNVYGTSALKIFQAWIGLDGAEDINYTYDPGQLPGPPGSQELTVGAENFDGSAGGQISGPPTEDLRVNTGKPGGSVTYSFKVRGVHPGNGQILTALNSPAVAGRTQEWDTIRVNRN